VVARNGRGGSGAPGKQTADAYPSDLPAAVCSCGATRIDSQLGLESTPEAYVEKMVQVFREVRRVLRDDGTLWLNLGDSYAGGGRGFGYGGKQDTNKGCDGMPSSIIPAGLKPKDLVGIPWRVAFALQADGWWLRQDIIWAKPNPMPESVTDRCTKAHEYIFLLTKSSRYFYDAEAVKEGITGNSHSGRNDHSLSPGSYYEVEENKELNARKGSWKQTYLPTSRNRRSVWTITTKPFSGAHFAVFPPEIPEICIKAGTSEKGCCPECGSPWERVVDTKRTFESGSGKSGNAPIGKNGPNLQGGGETGDIRRGPCVQNTTTGWRPTCTHNLDPIPCTVIDPFSGAGTTGLVAEKLGRKYIGIELNPAYVSMSEDRIYAEVGGLL